ncbi:hypothetical protein QE152_g40022 [Popillia japonica]|uniref:Double jelly roll-like domain-containing protein n=1 Tax=Popillia japonica TaxID=7064 RepID=A0AAW1HSL5_POPJA
MLMGFAEDVKQILMNVPQELVLKTCADDSDVIYNSVTTEEVKLIITNMVWKVKLIITNMVWRVPHVKVGISRELAFTKLTTRNALMELFFRGWEIHENPGIPQTTKHSWAIKTAALMELFFRGWEIHENPGIPQTTKHSWAIKTAPHLETPRYIILAFQTGRKGNIAQNMSKFDPISLTDVTAYLNGKRFPYENVEADFAENRIAVLYNMYSRFQSVYYGYEYTEPLLKLSQFKLCPLIGIDCSHQEDAIHRTGVEVRIEFTTKESIPKDTTAYCLILHNKMYEYSPFNKVFRRKY